MKVLVADDCNIAWDHHVDFFLYGGIVVDELEIRSLVENFLKIKDSRNIPKHRPIKWTNNKQTYGLLPEALHKLLKEDVLDLVSKSKIKIVVCGSPQHFYHRGEFTEKDIRMKILTEKQKQTQEYALNDLLEKFNLYLIEQNDVGLVMVDKFGQGIKQHMDNHCLKLFPKGIHGSIEKIAHPIIQIDSNESPIHQINDVILGSIYFSLREMGFNFLPQIRDNFWKKGNDYSTIIGRGFTLYPQLPKTQKIARAKEKILEKFKRLVINI